MAHPRLPIPTVHSAVQRDLYLRSSSTLNGNAAQVAKSELPRRLKRQRN
jgi:hypothetical protein